MKRIYTPDDKALVLATLAGNDGNVKRTARECDIPEQTVRDWKNEMTKGELPAIVQEALPEVIEEQVEQLTRVRDLALTKLEEAIEDGSVKGKDLITAFGVLSDKARLVQGLPTSRNEVVSDLPDPAAFARQLGGFIGEAIAAASQRSGEIEDAEWEEQAVKALPFNVS